MTRTTTAAFAVAALFTSVSARDRVMTVRHFATGCQILLPDDSVSVVSAIRRLISRPDSAYIPLRSSLNIPFAITDSIVEYRVDAACDSAATSYQASRFANSEPNVFIPVALFKIKGTSKYMGTGLIYYGEYKEFVVFDSTLAVIGKITTN